MMRETLRAVFRFEVLLIIMGLLFTFADLAHAKPVHGMLLAPGDLGPGIGFAYNVELKGKEQTKIDVVTKQGDVNCFLFDLDGILVRKVTDGSGCKMELTPTEQKSYIFLVQNASTTERAEYTTFMQ